MLLFQLNLCEVFLVGVYIFLNSNKKYCIPLQGRCFNILLISWKDNLQFKSYQLFPG